MDPVSSRMTVGLGREKGDVGCWSRRNLVSAEDMLGLVWSGRHQLSVGGLMAFPGAYVTFPQPTSATFPISTWFMAD